MDNTLPPPSVPKGGKRKRHWMAVEETIYSVVRSLNAYDRPLVTVISFKYLGQILMDSYDNWPEVVENLQNPQKIWDCLSRILVR